MSANAIDPNLKAGSTNEFIGGIDQEITPGFAVGAAYTYRKYINPIVGLPYDPTHGNDHHQLGLRPVRDADGNASRWNPVRSGAGVSESIRR